MIVALEGIRDSRGKFIAESNIKDAFGHTQLGGVAPNLSDLISKKLKLKTIGQFQIIYKEVQDILHLM